MVNETVFTDYCNQTNSTADWETVQRYIPAATREVMLRIGGNCPAEYEDAVNGCICEMAEIESAYIERLERSVASEHIGNYSVTYENAANLESRKKAEKKAALTRWLADTGLLYRGC